MDLAPLGLGNVMERMLLAWSVITFALGFFLGRHLAKRRQT